ncbi:MAG TPA: biotin--[acetyl-CoA-carboxylase] ligase [Gemmatimonadaceae bacterium]|nr:biotin--[acetyl-CoA-carboxylase] ligase [Gemmatimonadaceae bacterium]
MNPREVRYDGCTAAELAAALDVPDVRLFARVGSTLDVAHECAAAGAPAGTVVLADEQSAGRGRQGRSWVSDPGAGIWLSVVERPADAGAVGVLSLRLGLHAAAALDAFAPAPVKLKWPNDLYVDGRKLAGILVEARWREGLVDWLAVGFGINVQAPRGVPGAGLKPGTQRLDVLKQLVPSLRRAAAQTGLLAASEASAFAVRDYARGRRCREPVAGVVAGVNASGALLVDAADGRHAASAGSLVLVEDS